mgnify:CR=1 FL=1|jgi:hypothetical protein
MRRIGYLVAVLMVVVGLTNQGAGVNGATVLWFLGLLLFVNLVIARSVVDVPPAREGLDLHEGRRT